MNFTYDAFISFDRDEKGKPKEDFMEISFHSFRLNDSYELTIPVIITVTIPDAIIIPPKGEKK